MDGAGVQERESSLHIHGVAQLVTVNLRYGAGLIFLTLEDETGHANVIVMPAV
jgi:hypothetical protein